MNKYVMTILLACVSCLLAGAEPLLEIFEFGKAEPAVRAELTGNTQTFSGANWTCQAEKADRQVAGWILKFNSLSHEPVRLAVRFTAPLGFRPARYWDGARERAAETLPLERREFLDSFPLSTAEDGKQGRALGFAPQTILSGFIRALTEQGMELETRIVVDDRREQVLDIVSFDFKPDFGWCNAVEEYQNAFMKWFVPASGVDKRIYGVGGYFSGSYTTRPFELQTWRRSGLQWEWTYAPWLESGNWYAAGEGWQGEKAECRNYYEPHRGKALTREEFDEAIAREMYYGNKAAAMMFYILVKDIHRNVADKYPEAAWGTSGLHSLPTNRGKSRSAFAPGSPLFDYLKKQLKEIVDRYDVSGFSFDMANSSFHITIPSQLEYAVGRSWYDDGTIFTSDSVVPIPFSDYIHTLSRNGKTMGTVFNAALSDFAPFTFFHCDGAIMEGSPAYHVNMVLPLRLTMGRKPLSFWHGNPKIHPLNQTLLTSDPDRKARAEHGLREFYLLKCYEYGISPMNWVSVNPFFLSHLPVIRALSEAGYHPVSAVKGAAPFWAGRFGDGAGTILTFGNPKREKLTQTIRVVNRYLGDGKYAFLPPSGKLEQKIAGGETVFELTLEPKEVIALRTVQLKGKVSEFSAVSKDGTITLQANAPFEYTIPSVDFAGRSLDFTEKFVSGKAKKSVTLELLPACGIFAPEQTMTAVMAEGRTPALESGAAADTRVSAEMLAMYRPYIKASLRFNGTIRSHQAGFLDAGLARPDLEIAAPGSTPAGTLRICVGTPEDFPGFKKPENWSGPFLAMPDAETLWIGGSTPEQVRKAALVYFDLLDGEQEKR